ncbi:MAG: hypothetical protein WCI84_03145 [Bacteroidota bacterium]
MKSIFSQWMPEEASIKASPFPLSGKGYSTHKDDPFGQAKRMTESELEQALNEYFAGLAVRIGEQVEEPASAKAFTSAGELKHPGHADQSVHGRKRGGRLRSDLYSRGGFSYQPISKHTPKDGFMVSIFPEHETVFNSLDEITPATLNDYLDKRLDVFEKYPNAHFGAWHDEETGKVYLDISVHVPDEKEAHALARAHGQEGYFNVSQKQTVIVKPDEERRR